jgi:hypothetical protein
MAAIGCASCSQRHVFLWVATAAGGARRHSHRAMARHMVNVMERKIRHLVHLGDGRWHLEENGRSQAKFDTKHEAEAEGQRWGNELKMQGTNAQMVIHREDGSIEREYTYGDDPRRFPG